MSTRPRPGAGRRPTRATFRRRRTFAAALLAAALVAAWFALQAIAGGAGGGPLTATGVAGATPASARSWVVQPGDTLWGIALASGVGGDIRPYVDELSAETHDRPLVPGERIALPPR